MRSFTLPHHLPRYEDIFDGVFQPNPSDLEYTLNFKHTSKQAPTPTLPCKLEYSHSIHINQIIIYLKKNSNQKQVIHINSQGHFWRWLSGVQFCWRYRHNSTMHSANQNDKPTNRNYHSTTTKTTAITNIHAVEPPSAASLSLPHVQNIIETTTQKRAPLSTPLKQTQNTLAIETKNSTKHVRNDFNNYYIS